MDRDLTALTLDGLAALRRAAAMAHTVGTIRLRLSAAGESLVDVVPEPDDAHPSRPRAIDPCGFRIAVARAWADHVAGREIGLVGVARPEELSIGWSVEPPGRTVGFGSVRALCGGRMVWAFASLLDPPALSDALESLDATSGGALRTGEGLAARLVRDELLDATVVHVEADPPGSSTTRVLDEVLRRMVATVAAAELVDALQHARL